MDDALSGPWLFWAITLAVGVPVLLVVLTEVLNSLTRRGSAAAGPVRLLRNWVVPVGAVFALLAFAVQSPAEQVWTRVVATVLGFLVILLVLSAFNVVLFANAEPGSWRARIPSIFVDLARLALIVVGLAILFSWVWNADVGGLIAALGVTSIVIGLALQNAVGGIISGLLLLFEQPFRIGDWLDTGSERGRVIEVNWRAVHIETSSGTRIVPNASLAGASFTNLSDPPDAFEVVTTVSFATDDPPHEVISLLVEVAAGIPGRPGDRAASARYLGKGEYEVSLPVSGPAVEDVALGTFLAWLWYAARRRGLALDNDATDPLTEPGRLDDAIELIRSTLHLTADDVDPLRAAVHLERYGVGETVVAYDRVPDAVRFVIDGRLQLHVRAGDDELPFSTTEVGDYVGQGVLTRERTWSRSVAIETTTLLVVPLVVVDALVRNRPTLAREIGESMDVRKRRAAEALATAGMIRAPIAE